MDHNMSCPIWGTPATLLAGSIGDSAKLYSARAGGQYRISGEASEEVSTLSAKQKAIVTTWIVEERRKGTIAPTINTQELEIIIQRRSLKFSERVERFFRFLIAYDYNPASNIKMVNDFPAVDLPFHPQALLAWIEAATYEEGIMFLRLLDDDGLFRQPHFSGDWLVLTAKGFARLEEFQSGAANTLQAFVAMWFGQEMDEPWRTGIAPAIRDAGYQPFRIDGKEHNNKIDDEIVAEIKRSRFLVADFTCGGVIVNGKFEPNPRGGVYYEAGLAHGLGLEVIFTCRADRMDYAHFDTRQFAHIVWKTPDDLRVSLYNRIAATLQMAPGAPGKGRGSID